MINHILLRREFCSKFSNFIDQVLAPLRMIWEGLMVGVGQNLEIETFYQHPLFFKELSPSK